MKVTLHTVYVNQYHSINIAVINLNIQQEATTCGYVSRSQNINIWREITATCLYLFNDNIVTGQIFVDIAADMNLGYQANSCFNLMRLVCNFPVLLLPIYTAFSP
jgi:hypothetical protein